MYVKEDAARHAEGAAKPRKNSKKRLSHRKWNKGNSACNAVRYSQRRRAGPWEYRIKNMVPSFAHRFDSAAARPDPLPARSGSRFEP
jgi:hypothetical protein